MHALSKQAQKRHGRRLRRNKMRLVFDLHRQRRQAPPNASMVGATKGRAEAWERNLAQLFAAEVAAAGRSAAGEWLVDIVRLMAGIDTEFYAELLAVAINLGVRVPLSVQSVRTLGPSRRADVIPNRLRVDWSRA